jgi:hypothetical protein
MATKYYFVWLYSLCGKAMRVEKNSDTVVTQLFISVRMNFQI